MKFKTKMILSKLGDDTVAVPIGSGAGDLHGIIRLNDTGAVIWKALEDGLDEEKTAARLLTEFEGVTMDQARAAVRQFVDDLKRKNLLED